MFPIDSHFGTDKNYCNIKHLQHRERKSLMRIDAANQIVSPSYTKHEPQI